MVIILFNLPLCAKIELGVDCFFKDGHHKHLKGKKVGLVTNQTGVNGCLRPTIDLLCDHKADFELIALFGPEHGLNGQAYAAEKVKDGKASKDIPIYSLHGATRRPTEEMLKNIDVLIYDIQDIGVRAYTYATTLFYIMEEAAKRKIDVIVFDRPNPMNGLMVDGPMLEDKWRSYIGYVNVPYCHGMTIGELAHLFNNEYKIGCSLKVIPMQGWKRSMTFKDTGLTWMPTSPHIPEAETALFCASTGILGELGLVSIGVGYTLPFKIVGAPWIDGRAFAEALNRLKFPGVHFSPFHFRPFYGQFRGKDCQGVLIGVSNPLTYQPVTVQYALIGILKSLYPKPFNEALKKASKQKRDLFCKAIGTDRILTILENETYATYKMIDHHKEEREAFRKKRKKYLFSTYN